MLSVEDLHVSIEGKEIVRGVSFDLSKEAIMIIGPNGSGKSTMLMALMGRPRYETSGRIILDGEDISGYPTRKRSLKGLSLAFQNPVEVDGVKVKTLLNKIAEKFGRSDEEVKEVIRLMRLEELEKRYVNVGFSGGEKKRFELARLLLQRPKYALFDEPDSGVDADNMRIIAEGINRLISEGSGVVIVSHYARILRFVRPSRVYIMHNGKFVKQGDASLAEEVLENGYSSVLSE